MLKTFFFIPTNNQKFIKKVQDIDADYFVFDLEDSISVSEIDEAINNLRKLPIKDNYYVRPHIFDVKENHINLDCLKELINIGFENFVIPKISTVKELNNIKYLFESQNCYNFNKFKFILLVENPRCLMNLNEIVNSKILNITALTLGSHDYCNTMCMEHKMENLYFARHYVLNIAKAHDLFAIDIASMNIKDKEEFSNECFNAFSMGYDAKFILHPFQLKILKSINYYSKDEIEEALKVYQKTKLLHLEEFSAIKINGKIFEKSHLKRIEKIVEWNNTN